MSCSSRSSVRTTPQGLKDSPVVSFRCLRFSIASLTILFIGLLQRRRATDDPLLFPYTVNDRMYIATPHFISQRSSPPLHSPNPQLESLFAWERQYWDNDRLDSLRHLSSACWIRCVQIRLFLFVAPITLYRSRSQSFLLLDTQIHFFFLRFLDCFLGMIRSIWSQPHYAAPLTGCTFFIVTQALRHLGFRATYGRSSTWGCRARCGFFCGDDPSVCRRGGEPSFPGVLRVAPAGVSARPRESDGRVC